jgi:hypothetical protein
MQQAMQAMKLGVSGKSEELEALLETYPGVNVSLLEDKRFHLALHNTVVKGDSACVSLLIDAKADLLARTEKGQTALFFASGCGSAECLQVLIDKKGDIQSADNTGLTPAHAATMSGKSTCLQMLIDAKADVRAPEKLGWTPAMFACRTDNLTCLQLLVDNKADLSEQTSHGLDVLYAALTIPYGNTVHRVPGLPFAALSCNTDVKRATEIAHAIMKTTPKATVTTATVTTAIEEYKYIQAFINECHNVTKHALSEDVVVDTRVGRSYNGLYHEPLEQVLLYLGLSMHKNQTVNKSIDGKSTPRALIPGHPTNANLWYELYQCTHCSSCSTRLTMPKKCPCHPARDCASDYQRVE